MKILIVLESVTITFNEGNIWTPSKLVPNILRVNVEITCNIDTEKIEDKSIEPNPIKRRSMNGTVIIITNSRWMRWVLFALNIINMIIGANNGNITYGSLTNEAHTNNTANPIDDMASCFFMYLTAKYIPMIEKTNDNCSVKNATDIKAYVGMNINEINAKFFALSFISSNSMIL